MSKKASLLKVREMGFDPQFIIDVGANSGTYELFEVFPLAHHIMIEPLAEHTQTLQTLCYQLPRATYVCACVGATSGTATMYAMPGGEVSSLLADNEDLPAGAEQRVIDCITIRRLTETMRLPAPGLIKIDVDGKELEVLAGMEGAVDLFEYIVIEVVLYAGAYQIITWMHEHNFVLFDIIDPLYRDSDGALWQVDMAFVKKDGVLRQNKGWK